METPQKDKPTQRIPIVEYATNTVGAFASGFAVFSVGTAIAGAKLGSPAVLGTAAVLGSLAALIKLSLGSRNPVKRGLALILNRMADLAPQQKHAKEATDAVRMRECVESILEKCHRFQRSCPKYFPDSERIEPFIQALEECLKLPVETEVQKKSFVYESDRVLTILCNEAAELLKKL